MDVKCRTTELTNSKQHKTKKNKYHTLSLVTDYHPTTSYTPEDITKHNKKVITFIEVIPKKSTIIIGADINTATGARTKTNVDDEMEEEDMIQNLIGPFGNKCRNKNGNLFCDVMRELDLHSAHSFFDCNDKHDTWIHLGTKHRYQPDHFLILSKQLNRTSNVKRKFDGAPSDHAALMIQFKLHSSN